MVVLLPFNSAGWFAGYVIHHPINTPDFVNDTVRNLAQKLVRQFDPVGGHGIGRMHRTNGADVLISSFVAHNPHGLDRRQNREGLPAGEIKTALVDFFLTDAIASPHTLKP